MRRREAKETKEGRHAIRDQAGATRCPRADSERKGSKDDKHHRRERKGEEHRGTQKRNLPGRDVGLLPPPHPFIHQVPSLPVGFDLQCALAPR